MNISDLPIELFEQICGSGHFYLINKSLNKLDTICDSPGYIYKLIMYNNIKLLNFHLVRHYNKCNKSNKMIFFYGTFVYLLDYAISTFNKKILQLCITSEYIIMLESFYGYKNMYRQYTYKIMTITYHGIYGYYFKNYPIKYLNWLHKYFNPPLNDSKFYYLTTHKNIIYNTHNCKLKWLYKKGYYLPAHIRLKIYYKKLIN